MKPEELLYAKTHEWVSVSESGGTQVATVGISAFAVELLNDLVFLELPKVGQQLEAGRPLGEIESVKAVSDIYSPVTGEVVAVNTDLAEALDTLKDDPYSSGWMVKIRVEDNASLSQLMDHRAYTEQCESEQ